jgi:hypothetical protein
MAFFLLLLVSLYLVHTPKFPTLSLFPEASSGSFGTQRNATARQEMKRLAVAN